MDWLKELAMRIDEELLAAGSHRRVFRVGEWGERRDGFHTLVLVAPDVVGGELAEAGYRICKAARCSHDDREHEVEWPSRLLGPYDPW